MVDRLAASTAVLMVEWKVDVMVGWRAGLLVGISVAKKVERKVDE